MSASEFIKAVTATLNAGTEASELARRFMAPSRDVTRYVVGRNEQSMELIEKSAITGLIDDFSRDASDWCGVPVVNSFSVHSDAIIANCSTSISPINVYRNLNRAGLRQIVSFSDLLKASPETLNLPWFVEQQRKDVALHLQEWTQLYELLSDVQSKQTLLDVVRFRLSADPVYMESYTVRLKDQYFETFLDSSRQVFVDAGGFDGDTTEEFCRRYPDYRKVFLFEPSPINMAAARKQLAQTRNVEFHEVGISDHEGTLHFDTHAGSASSVTEDEGESITVTTLDCAIHEPVSWIKMDLEGWEIKALHGAQRLIMEHSPQLTIAVYHRASDFRDIARYVLSINPTYRLHLRHYTQGWSETVMFFSPASSQG
ncbi:FkbM family methyltransferase [Acidithiobacillus thiooxidans]|uniref:FkbM family methyltransferase n=1 Tax=Acidithiobacillus thiooxidans TaxID=930 RepID=UPI000262506F|nr:FkbM family methyltransferase [Acidithiobacillus thiooxidans]MBU2811474.1 FkbM family methyltransferase [Acidithiobacillus thiooxidans]